MSEIPTPLGESPPASPRPVWIRWFIHAENGLIGIVLFAMLLLPLLEIALRKVFQVGISG